MKQEYNIDMIEKMKEELTMLEQRARELSACLTAMTLVGSTLNLDEVLDRAINCAKEVMNAEAASVMLIDTDTGELFFKQASGAACDKIKEVRIPKGEGIAGWVAETGEPALIEDAQNDTRFFRAADDKTGFVTKSILAVPLKVKNKIIGVAEVINKMNGNFSIMDIPLFTAYASLAAVSIENARMHSQLIEQELVARELEISRQIQEALQGPEFAQLGHYRFNAVSVAARSVGGDFYDWIDIGEGKTIMLIGDVSGKGVPAALLMSNTISRIRAEAGRLVEPRDILSLINSVLAKEFRRGLFVTLFMLLAEPDGHIHYANAGHQMPLFYSNGKFSELSKVGGPPLGIVPDYKYEQGYAKLSAGDLIVVYTDGVTEAVNPKNEFYEIERLKQAVLNNIDEPDRIAANIKKDVEKFEQGSERRDDLTALVLYRSHTSAAFHKKYDNLTPDDLAGTRDELGAYLSGLGISEKVISPIILSIDEALTNVIRHAYEGKGGPAELKCSADNKEIIFELRDKGCGRIPEIPEEAPKEIKPGGLGLVILKQVMNEVSFEESSGGGCILKMKKYIE